MPLTWEQKLRVAELQAETYRLQKILARREPQTEAVIQGESSHGTAGTRPDFMPPVPFGSLPTRRERYKACAEPPGAAGDYIGELASLPAHRQDFTPGELVEMLSRNRDKYLRQHHNPNIRRIGVLTSGGDAPGMNAALRAATLTVLNFDYPNAPQAQIYGIPDGYGGLCAWAQGGPPPSPLTRDRVWNIASSPGSILRSVRFESWKSESADPTLNFSGILDGLVAIGGDGTARGAKALWQNKRLPVVACPGTIDNDTHPWSDRSIGFDSAVSMATTLLQALRATADASGRLFLAQLMGRRRGDLPLFAGIVGHADLILTQERSTLVWDHHRLLRLLRLIYQEIELNPYHSALVAVAEGVELPDDLEQERGAGMIEPLLIRLNLAFQALHSPSFPTTFLADGQVERRPAYKQQVLDLWTRLQPQRARIKLDIRTMDLGHAQRGGVPVPSDILLASRIGAHAVDVLRSMDWDWAENAHPNEVPFIGIIHDRPAVTWVDPD